MTIYNVSSRPILQVASDPGENIKTEVEQTSQESTNVNTHSDQGVSSDTDKLHNSDNTANTDIAASLQNAAGLPENTEMETSVENSDSQLEPATTEKEKEAGDSNSPQVGRLTRMRDTPSIDKDS